MNGRIISGERRIVQSDLHGRAARAAGGFAALDIGEDSSVAMVLRNDFAFFEAVLIGMPGVLDCAVFGIPDDEFGEILCVHVQPAADVELTAEQVRAWLGRQIANYKVPRTIEFADTLPREDSGKIFKRKLRAPYWETTGRRI